MADREEGRTILPLLDLPHPSATPQATPIRDPRFTFFYSSFFPGNTSFAQSNAFHAGSGVVTFSRGTYFERSTS